MSDECCSPDKPRTRTEVTKSGNPQRLTLSMPPPSDRNDKCACSIPEEFGARAPEFMDEGDVCCGPNQIKRTAEPGAIHESRPPWWRDFALLPSVISGLLLAVAYTLDWAGFHAYTLVLQTIALLVGAYTFVPGAIRRLVRGRLGVSLLMTIAAIGAVFLGHVGEAAALAFLFSLAEALEDRAMDRAKEGLRSLLSLIPETARISRLNGEQTILVADIRELDILIVGAGERIATDGVIVEGHSSLDTAAVTGESIPVEAGPGDPVMAGSVNGAGTLRIEASADGRDNSLTKIVTLVTQAHARKGEQARLADRIAKPLVPAVLITAALICVFGFVVGNPWMWVERALVVLVAASPCALAIAVPVTVISAIGSASRLGVIIKSGAAFEQFGTIRTVAFDKTGTLTQGAPKVVETRTAPGYRDFDILTWAGALEAHSGHPLAAAIAAAAPVALAATDIVEEAGHGIIGVVNGRHIRVGNPRWIDPGALGSDAASLSEAGMTIVVVEADGNIAGIIGVRDELRPEAAGTITMLHSAGISTVMLTGDNAHTARTLATQAGIMDVRAEQLPADKAAAIDLLAAVSPTAMVGDGINDAPPWPQQRSESQWVRRVPRPQSSPPILPSPVTISASSH